MFSIKVQVRVVLAVVVTLFTFQANILCYKPVVIIHGILDDAASLNDLKSFIETEHPGTNVTVIKLYAEIESLSTPMWTQMHGVEKVIKEVMSISKYGIHIIGFSQGGLLARVVIENCSDHNVQNFISLSSPQMGQFGVTSYFAKYLPKLSRKFLFGLLYTEEFQEHLSIANYWNDPLHTVEYLKGNVFLPFVNNNKNSRFVDEERYALQKSNFAKLKNLVVIGGPDDGVITPWQSALFGFYDENLNITVMENQVSYTEDWFGLGTLGKRNAIHSYVFPNIHHTSWHGSKLVFKKAIQPWLT